MADESIESGSFFTVSKEGEADEENNYWSKYDSALVEVKRYLTFFNGAGAPKRAWLRAKSFVAIKDVLMRRIKKDLRVVPAIQNRKGIYQAMHDE